MRRAALLPLVMLAVLAPVFARAAAPDTTAVGQLRSEARALDPLVRSKLAKRFLAATAQLPSIAPRTVFYDSSRTHYWNAREAAALPESTRVRTISRVLDESFYYNTRYGSPLAYARPLEILAAAGCDDVAGRRIADFGYGTIGQLRLLASLGADMHGIDVDPLLEALYSEPGDQGAIAATHGRGSLAIHTGHFPAEEAITRAVGGDYDVFLSKNTLKNGYLHPAEPVNPRMLVHLGVDDSSFVHRLAAIVKPGGWLLIYNLCPAPGPPGKPYIPWADGRCPFPRPLLEAAGFEVIAFDRDDSTAARTMGHALGWDGGESPMDLAHDLFATYTLCQRSRR